MRSAEYRKQKENTQYVCQLCLCKTPFGYCTIVATVVATELAQDNPVRHDYYRAIIAQYPIIYGSFQD